MRVSGCQAFRGLIHIVIAERLQISPIFRTPILILNPKYTCYENKSASLVIKSKKS